MALRRQRRYLHSSSARIASLAIAYRRHGKRWEAEEAGASLAFFADLVGVNPWTSQARRSVAAPVERDNNKPRWVFRFERIAYAAQRLALDAAKAISTPEPCQFAARGGRPAIEAWLETHLPETALVITTDIPSCFDKVLRHRIDVGLALPGRVTKAVLFDPKDKARFLDYGPRGLVPMDPRKIDTVSSPMRGVPQGSALSCFATEMVIGESLRRVAGASPTTLAASYSDNLIFLLQEGSEESQVVSAFTSAVAETFGGDVIVELTRRIQRHSACVGFDFCGRHYAWKAGKLDRRLTTGRLESFSLRTTMAIGEAQVAKNPEEFARLRRSILGWAAQNAPLKGVMDEAVELLAHLSLMAHPATPRLAADIGFATTPLPVGRLSEESLGVQTRLSRLIRRLLSWVKRVWRRIVLPFP